MLLALSVLVALGRGLDGNDPEEWWPVERVAEAAEAAGVPAGEVEPALCGLVGDGMAREVRTGDGGRYFRATEQGVAAVVGDVAEVEAALETRLDELGGDDRADAEVVSLADYRARRAG